MKTGRWVVKLEENNGGELNYRARNETKFIIIHAIAEYIDTGEPGKTPQYCVDFLRERNELPHYFLTPSGIVLKGIPHNLMANHARGFNYCSVGIEVMLPGCHSYASFVKAMGDKNEHIPAISYPFLRLEGLIKELLEIYPNAKIVGHNELSPDRKVDPGYLIDVDILRERFGQTKPTIRELQAGELP